MKVSPNVCHVYQVPYGAVGRIYFHKSVHKTLKGTTERHYDEGWFEFADKRIAKRVARSFNNTPVGGRRRAKYADCLWTMKYLNRCGYTRR